MTDWFTQQCLAARIAVAMWIDEFWEAWRKINNVHTQAQYQAY